MIAEGKRVGEISIDGFVAWMFNNKTTTLITLAVILDWLPNQIFSQGSLITSATKFIVMPLLIVDFFRGPGPYLRFNYGWLFLAGLLIGTGGGVVTGVVEIDVLFTLLPNIGILLYYLKPRSWDDIRNILYIATVSSALVPIWLILAQFGIVRTDIEIEMGGLTRFFAGPSRSALALLLAFIPASFGGVLLLRAQIPKLLLPVTLIMLVLFAPLLTGQRAANFVVWVCLSLVVVLSLRLKALRQVGPYIALFTVILALGLTFWGSNLEDYAQPLMIRLQGYGEAEYNAEYRVVMYKAFLEELTSSFSLTATGYEPSLILLGGGYHFIVGEAYTLGGFILSSILFMGIFLSGIRLASLWTQGDEVNYKLVSVLLCLYIAFLINQFTHAGLNVRPVYLLLGLWLSAGKVDRQPMVLSYIGTGPG